MPIQETQETWVRSLGQEDPLEEKMTTYSSYGLSPMPKEPSRLRSMGHKELDMTEHVRVNA